MANDFMLPYFPYDTRCLHFVFQFSSFLLFAAFPMSIMIIIILLYTERFFFLFMRKLFGTQVDRVGVCALLARLPSH